ncbi:hypothetical protein EVAR_60038_1 [Eumeta japonica]|uniref:Uncharacterized protein n=1 Tax=Eumeta variegata TaxID=151549 RepID=A0A4C1YZ16_EUMVA|nr:hypothetical protein EVAR_60038_1 [Eumeta japonica]
MRMLAFSAAHNALACAAHLIQRNRLQVRSQRLHCLKWMLSFTYIDTTESELHHVHTTWPRRSAEQRPLNGGTNAEVQQETNVTRG